MFIVQIRQLKEKKLTISKKFPLLIGRTQQLLKYKNKYGGV